MTWQVAWAKEASKDLGKLDGTLQGRIVNAVERYAETGYGDVKALRGSAGYRLRVGDYRVRFERQNDRLVVLVLHVRHRREAYR